MPESPALLPRDRGHRLGELSAAVVVGGPARPARSGRAPYEPLWRKAARWVGRRAVQSLVVSLVVWLVTLPLVALRFHLVSPIGVLMNLPYDPADHDRAGD